MTKPAPFMLRIPDADIADLRDRLARTRFPDSAPGEAWAYGTDVAYLRHLVDYWRGEFDWRAEEAALNVFPQFRTSVDGIDLHYLHVPSVGENPMPLLLLHGWPGSVVEFWDIIGPLTGARRAPSRSRPKRKSAILANSRTGRARKPAINGFRARARRRSRLR